MRIRQSQNMKSCANCACKCSELLTLVIILSLALLSPIFLSFQPQIIRTIFLLRVDMLVGDPMNFKAVFSRAGNLVITIL